MSYGEPPSYGAPPPPPPPPGGGEPPYGGTGTPYGAGVHEPKNSVMAVIALVTGIIGVIPCFWGCFVFQIAAVVLGILGKKEVAESNGSKKGEGMAQWGLILGVIGVVLCLLYWIVFATTDVFSFDVYGDFE